ncbi:DMT family transporter [Massilia sp. YIM B02443]|uniref:DMT family transporter n=1 Tax=Massilia sp. YIM B02443 TaxID=3050127 RepID=UPI0025B6CAF1|nr:DMT family transporter [Massilia sp. YIM B02443]MDN4039360.1 DMT family transporter [Massilia sp. YIM B02443]
MDGSTTRLARWMQDGRFYAVLAAAGFSMKAVFVKLGYAAAPVEALTLLAIRMGCALPLFLWLLWMARERGADRLSAKDIGRILLLGFTGYYLASLFDFFGLETVTAGLERLILYLYPSLVLIFQVCLTGERPTARTLQAMAICYLGLGVGFVHDMQLAGWSHEVLAGAAWVFASAVSYALYYIGTGAVVQRIGSMRLAGLAGSASCVLVLAHFLALGEPAALPALPPSVWLYGALMALVSTVLPIYWTALAISRLGAAQTAAFGNLGPVLTVFASWLLLGEPLSVWQLGGLALVLFGVMRLKPAPRRPAPDRTGQPRPSVAQPGRRVP